MQSPFARHDGRAARAAAILAASAILAAAAAYLVPTPKAPAGPAGSAPAPAAHPAVFGDYVGDGACQSCHPREFTAHSASNHARALRPATAAALGALCPPAGRIGQSQYALVERDGRLFFEVNVAAQPDKYQLWPLDYAFGSGRTGITFASMMDGRNVVEMKMSYFPATGTWGVTPGQVLDNPVSAGRIRDLKDSRHCLECHSDAVPATAFTPPSGLLGVGCESCHGPGRRHVEAAQGRSATSKPGRAAPDPAAGMERLDRLTARALNERCGACHSTQEDIARSVSPEISARMTYRFQPYGIMQSRCFRESGERLSCLTCHDPHANAATGAAGAAAYTRACLGCHGSAAAPKPGAAAPNQHQYQSPTLSRTVVARRCPINPSADCVRCHMPKRDFKFATHEASGIQMTEHRIAVYPNATTPPAPPPAAPAP